MNYYQFHIGDYAVHTGHLDPMEDLAYRRMLDIYYLREWPLPADPAEVARLIRMKQHVKEVESVLREFFTLTDDGWRNTRCDQEIEAYANRHEAAARSARSRWERQKAEKKQKLTTTNARAKSSRKEASDEAPMQTQCDRNASVVRPQCEPNANHKPITNNQEPKNTSTPSSLEILPAREAENDDDAPKDVAGWIDFFRSEHGVVIDPHSMHDRKKFWPLATAWTKAGVTVGQMRQAIAKARAQATEPIAYLPAYADRVLMTSAAKPPRSRATTLNPQEAIEHQNRAVAESWLAQTV